MEAAEDVGYANLNTGAFDGDGIHWFTGQNGIYGRLDPGTGEIKVFKDPDGRGPYGIAATPQGDIYTVSLAGSHLAKVDQEDGRATIIEPPHSEPGRAAGLVRQQGRFVDLRMEQRPAEPLFAGDQGLEELEIAW